METITKIPEFQTLEEMAEFWDTHEITDFEDGLIEVKEPVFASLQKRSITVMLDEEQYALVAQLAEQQHLNVASLINEWISNVIQEKGKMAMGH